LVCEGDIIPFSFTGRKPEVNVYVAYVEEKVRMQQIDLYCRKCRCKTDFSNQLTGNPEFQLLFKAIVKCHTCRRVLKIPKLLEGEAVAQADSSGRVYR